MFNPFIKFELRFIPRFRELKKRYLVSQTFTRANDLFQTKEKVYLMLTHYDDPGRAKIHYNAISGEVKGVKKDQYAATLDLEKEEHRKKLEQMLAPDSKYVIYSSLIQDQRAMENAMDNIFKQNIKKYIEKNTSWSIPRDYTLAPKTELTFGELYIVMKFAGQTARVKLEDLEKV